MKSDIYTANMRRGAEPYTTYEGGGPRPAPSYGVEVPAAGKSGASAKPHGKGPDGPTQRVVHRINFRILPAPGTVLMHEGQRYLVTGSDLHTRRDGQSVPIILWESDCATCGKPFQCWSGLRSGSLNRRCPAHHAAGKSVAAAGRRRVAAFASKHGRRN